MSGSQRRTAQEDSIRPVLFPGYHTTCLPIKRSSVWCLCASAGTTSEVLPTQKPHCPPPPPPPPPLSSEGTDTTLCPKKAVITGWMGDCYISTRLPIEQAGPADARFKTSTSSYSRITQGRLKHKHISTSEAGRRGKTKQEKKQRLLTCFEVCRVAKLFGNLKMIKRELWSGWNKFPVVEK